MKDDPIFDNKKVLDKVRTKKKDDKSLFKKGLKQGAEDAKKKKSDKKS